MATFVKRCGRWRAQIRVNGKFRSKTFDSKREAQAWASETEVRSRKGELPDAEANRTTLAEALQRYLAEVTPTKRGAAQETVRIHQWLRDPIATQSLASIRSIEIAAWRDKATADGKAPATIRNHLTIISQIYRTAMHEWGLVGLQNPVLNVRMPRQRPGRNRRLEVGEYEPLLMAASADPNPWIEHAIVLAIETALRAGELLAIRRNQISNRIATLDEEQTKTGRVRAVPLSTLAMQTLDVMPRSFDGRVVPVKKSTLDKAWKRVCRAADVEDLHWHDLRHEATSRLFEKGLDMAQVMSITGHTTTTMVSRYSHLRAKDLIALLG